MEFLNPLPLIKMWSTSALSGIPCGADSRPNYSSAALFILRLKVKLKWWIPPWATCCVACVERGGSSGMLFYHKWSSLTTPWRIDLEANHHLRFCMQRLAPCQALDLMILPPLPKGTKDVEKLVDQIKQVWAKVHVNLDVANTKYKE